MVGQLALDQRIGVRLPASQPRFSKPLACRELGNGVPARWGPPLPCGASRAGGGLIVGGDVVIYEFGR